MKRRFSRSLAVALFALVVCYSGGTMARPMAQPPSQPATRTTKKPSRRPATTRPQQRRPRRVTLDASARRNLFRWMRSLREGTLSQRKAAVRGLRSLAASQPRVRVALVRALYDPAREVRLLAAKAIAGWGASVLPLLRTVLGSRRKEVRWAAAFAVARIQPSDQSLRSALLLLLRDRYFRVRLEAVRGLSRQKPFSARLRRAVTATAREDSHPKVRALAVRVLRPTTKKGGKP